MAVLLSPPSSLATLIPVVAFGIAALLAAVWMWVALMKARRATAAANEALRLEHAQHAEARDAAAASLQAERELVELRSRFVSLVSHEFRTPLGVIMSAGDLLKNYRERLSAEQQAELVNDITESTRRMSALMEQVLLIGRVDAGKLAARIAPVSLPDLVRDIVNDQCSAFGGRCPIVLDLADGLDGARADAGLVRHILSNLISNAVKYSSAEAEVHVRVTREDGDAVFEIVDRGIGIPETDLAHLYEAFHRAANVGDTPGSGLGLLIVKRCVDLHGGRLSVRSVVGQGTTVEVWMPLFAAP